MIFFGKHIDRGDFELNKKMLIVLYRQICISYAQIKSGLPACYNKSLMSDDNTQASSVY